MVHGSEVGLNKLSPINIKSRKHLNKCNHLTPSASAFISFSVSVFLLCWDLHIWSSGRLHLAYHKLPVWFPALHLVEVMLLCPVIGWLSYCVHLLYDSTWLVCLFTYSLVFLSLVEKYFSLHRRCLLVYWPRLWIIIRFLVISTSVTLLCMKPGF